jgi:hypothetical protein
MMLEYSHIDSLIDTAERKCEENCQPQPMNPDAQKRREDDLLYFKEVRQRLDQHRSQLQGFRPLVVKTMAGPAFLSVLFSVLLWVGSGTGCLKTVGGISIAVACLGFVWIIRWAVKAWPKTGE